MNVSIAMATYNGEIYIKDQLDSFLVQSRMPDELIVCDDKSEDQTLEIVNEFKQRAPFEVKVFKNKKNIGYIKNFEKAISRAGGDLIFLSDQDDVWFSNKIKRVVDIFTEHPSLLVIINDQEIVDDDLISSGVTKLGQLQRIGYSDDEFNTGCCTAFHSSLKPYIIPVPAKYTSHDVWIHKIAHYLNKRYTIKQVLQYYRRHQDNVSDGMVRQKEKINPLSFYLDAFSRKADNYDNKIALLEEVRERIESNSKDDMQGSEIAKKIDRDISAWKRRNKLKEYGFYKKRYFMLKMLVGGDYDRFDGYRSFFKDFIK